MRTAAAGTNSLLYRWVPSVGPVHETTPRCGQKDITTSSTPVKKRAFYGRSQVPASRAHTRPRKPTNSEEVSKIKALWRTEEMTKPEYVRLCNQIHLLDLRANKGGKEGEEARKAKLDFVTDLVGSKATSQAKGKPGQRRGPQP